MRRTVRYSLAALALAAMSGCDAGSNAPAAQSAPTGSAPPTRATRAEARHVPIAVPPQFLNCGQLDAAGLSNLVSGGLATALVKITVTDPPGDVVNNERTVTVASSQILAGLLTNGPLNTIQEADQADTNTLPPGDYIVLLGSTGVKGSYFLSDGGRGSFVLDGNLATEQCPGPDMGGPSAPASIDASTLIARVAAALLKTGS